MELTQKPIHKHHNLENIIDFIKKNIVMIIAFFAAAITCIFVPINKDTLVSIDLKTISCLFCTLAIVGALNNIRFFYATAYKIVNIFKNTKKAILALVYITFISSMLIANDMSLLTFLPLGYIVLTSTKKEKYMAFTFIMPSN